jgi:hypothetical protein
MVANNRIKIHGINFQDQNNEQFSNNNRTMIKKITLNAQCAIYVNCPKKALKEGGECIRPRGTVQIELR